MKIHLLAVGTRMPAWVTAGFTDYARRLPRHCELCLQEVAAPRRGARDQRPQWLAREARALLAAVPANCRRVALAESGRLYSTPELAALLEQWLSTGQDVALLVGGPDGLSPAVMDSCEFSWSLSPLTFPHTLVRVLVAEQLYRAWSLIANLPYHRQ